MPPLARRSENPLTWQVLRDPETGYTGLRTPEGRIKWWSPEQLADLLVAVLTEPNVSERNIALARHLAGRERWAEAVVTINAGLEAQKVALQAA